MSAGEGWRKSRARARRFVGMLFLLVVHAAYLHAQRVTGKVIDREGGVAVSGVVVSAIDASGRVTGRAITDRAGAFGFQVSGSVRTLQARRIGYRPADSVVTVITDRPVILELQRLIPHLEPIVSTSSVQCSVRPDRGAAVAYWTQAQYALMASKADRETRPSAVSILSFRYSFGPNGKSLPQEVKRVESLGLSRAFGSSRSAQELADEGYVSEVGGQRLYYGPDEDVLLDDVFMKTHCFSLVPSSERDSLVGVRFEAAKGRIRLSDVQGTLWLRKSPLQLRSIEYEYVGLEREVMRLKPAGSVDYVTPDNGIPLAYRWHIRAVSPQIGPQQGVFYPATAHEAGAVIDRIEWANDPPWSSSLSSITGHVIEDVASRPAVDRTVQLVGTPFFTQTDSTGYFELPRILDGVYRLSISNQAIASFGIEKPVFTVIDIPPGGQAVRTSGVESAVTIADHACRQESPAKYQVDGQFGKSVVLGQVRYTDGSVLESDFIATVSIVAQSSPVVLRGHTDTKGRFRLCGALPGVVTIEIPSAAGVTRQSVTVSPGAPVTLIDVAVIRP